MARGLSKYDDHSANSSLVAGPTPTANCILFVTYLIMASPSAGEHRTYSQKWLRSAWQVLHGEGLILLHWDSDRGCGHSTRHQRKLNRPLYGGNELQLLPSRTVHFRGQCRHQLTGTPRASWVEPDLTRCREDEAGPMDSWSRRPAQSGNECPARGPPGGECIRWPDPCVFRTSIGIAVPPYNPNLISNVLILCGTTSSLLQVRTIGPFVSIGAPASLQFAEKTGYGSAAGIIVAHQST